MKVLITIGFFGIAMASCHRAIVPQVTQQTKDSVVYKVTPHDTTIFIEGHGISVDSVDLGEPVTTEWLREHAGEMSGSLGTLPVYFDTTATSGNVKLHVNITKGKLTASCKADSLQKVIRYMSETLEKYHGEKQIEKVPVIVPVNHIPKWVWYLLAANILFLAWTFRMPLLMLIKTVFKRFL